MHDRRELLQTLTALGIGTLPFQRALAQQAKPDEQRVTITPEMIKQAEWVAGITLTDEQRKAVASAVTANARGVIAGHAIKLPNHVPPAIHFACVPGDDAAAVRGEVKAPKVDVAKPKNDDLPWLPAHQLAHLLATRQVSSVDLAKLFLDRLHKHNETLKFVVTFTDDLAMKQARKADEERAKGKVRSAFHGIPWGAKDLISVAGYPTTWGAPHYKTQTIDHTATVAKTLEAAGMVLLAKTTLGALAWGDQWFGGQTKNPWNPSRGSSGSSAGSASTVAAGCLPVAVGSETLGSIISPSRECGVTGLRPTFGRISRDGCMTLSWTMDKLGPMARSVDDCAIMLGLMHGRDVADAASVTKPFDWPCQKAIKDFKVGYFEGATLPVIKHVVETVKGLGCQMVPVKLPSKIPQQAMSLILSAEAATAFDDLTREGVSEGIGNWPATFREGRFITAVDYLRANRLRTLLMKDMAELMSTVDLMIGADDLRITNLTGHPSICLPAGHSMANERLRPQTITMTGRLYGESELLQIAKAFQDATSHHLKRPTLA